MQGSQNHLRAFASQIAKQGASYNAEFLTQAEFDQIARSSGQGHGQQSAGRGANNRWPRFTEPRQWTTIWIPRSKLRRPRLSAHRAKVGKRWPGRVAANRDEEGKERVVPTFGYPNEVVSEQPQAR